MIFLIAPLGQCYAGPLPHECSSSRFWPNRRIVTLHLVFRKENHDARRKTDVRNHPDHSAHDSVWRIFSPDSLMNKTSGYMENPLRQNFFRAGHAHAGVIVILSLICQVLADAAVLPTSLMWFVRIGVPLSAILISAGFFFSVLPPNATRAGGAVSLIYAGMAERTPNALASYEAAQTTERLACQATITGLPRRSGLSRCSTDA
jgi:hypothetical protein